MQLIESFWRFWKVIVPLTLVLQFIIAGKGGVTPQHFNGLTPASRNNSEVAGLPYPPSVQASRTKVATSHIVGPRPAELLGKADGYQDVWPCSSPLPTFLFVKSCALWLCESLDIFSHFYPGTYICGSWFQDEKLPRRLEFDVQAVERTGEHASTEQHLLDTVSHTGDLGKSKDPFLHQVNQDGEFTELELTVPGEKKGIEDHNVKISGSDSNVEHLDQPMSVLPTSLHEREETVSTETFALGDSAIPLNEREIHKEDQAGEITVAEGLSTGSVTENVPDNAGMPVEEDAPKIAGQVVQG